jgi:hypothetical protein
LDAPSGIKTSISPSSFSLKHIISSSIFSWYMHVCIAQAKGPRAIDLRWYCQF